MRLPFSGSYPLNQAYDDGCCRQSYVDLGKSLGLTVPFSGHNGLDFGLPCGTQVVAATDGDVFSAYEAGGYGNYIFLTAPDGSQTAYGHLSEIQVKSGRVSAGQNIGLSGNTGHSSGCHLHFGYRPKNYNYANGFLGYEDPTALLNKGSEDEMYQGKTAQQWAEFWKQDIEKERADSRLNAGDIRNLCQALYGKDATEAELKRVGQFWKPFIYDVIGNETFKRRINGDKVAVTEQLFRNK